MWQMAGPLERCDEVWKKPELAKQSLMADNFMLDDIDSVGQTSLHGQRLESRGYSLEARG